jgi:hypothetical protein
MVMDTRDADRPGTTGAAAVKASAEHDALIIAMERLRGALTHAAPDGGGGWARDVEGELREVRSGIEAHREAAEAADGMLAQVEEAMPGAHFRLEGLRKDHSELLAAADALLAEAGRRGVGGDGAAEAVRHEAALLLTRLRNHQEREVDLVFDAFESDLGTVE